MKKSKDKPVEKDYDAGAEAVSTLATLANTTTIEIIFALAGGILSDEDSAKILKELVHLDRL